MSWEDIIKEDLGNLRVGDYIEADRNRRGIVTSISIQMTKYDPAGESKSAAQVEEYETSLGYNGSITFGPDAKGDYYWTYLGRITRIVPKEELDEDGVPKEESQ
jgi:hypothetical protein